MHPRPPVGLGLGLGHILSHVLVRVSHILGSGDGGGGGEGEDAQYASQ